MDADSGIVKPCECRQYTEQGKLHRSLTQPRSPWEGWRSPGRRVGLGTPWQVGNLGLMA